MEFLRTNSNILLLSFFMQLPSYLLWDFISIERKVDERDQPEGQKEIVIKFENPN